MKRLLPFLLFASSLCGQTLVQAPQGVKSATNVAAVMLLSQTAGNVNLVGISYCENSCAVNPQNDTLAVTTSNGDACTLLKSSQVANEAGSIWSCPVSGSITTVTAVVTGFKSGDYIHNAISVSEWTAAPPIFALAIGGSCTPAAGFTLANPFNGSSETFYGSSGTPVCNPSPPGGILFTTPPAPPVAKSINFTYAGQVLAAPVPPATTGMPFTGALAVYQLQGGSSQQVAYVIPDANGNVSGTLTLLTNFQDMISLNGYNYNAAGTLVAKGSFIPFPGAFLGSQANGQTLHSITGFVLMLSCTPIMVNGTATGVNSCASAPGSNLGSLN